MCVRMRVSDTLLYTAKKINSILVLVSVIFKPEFLENVNFSTI